MARIFIYDTTLRDGSQGEGVNFSLQDKLLITAQLDTVGFDYIEGGYPLSNPKDAAYFRAVIEEEELAPEILRFIGDRGAGHDDSLRGLALQPVERARDLRFRRLDAMALVQDQRHALEAKKRPE